MACPCIIATDWLGVLIRLDIPLDNKDNVLSVIENREYSTQPSQLRKDNITKKSNITINGMGSTNAIL